MILMMKKIKIKGEKIMENYINLYGNKIELTQEQIEKIAESVGRKQVKLGDIPAGDLAKIGKYEFIVLEHSKETTAIILKDLLYENKQFGSNNNYKDSNADKLCCEFEKEIAKIVGEDNLIEHTVDLTSDDGLKDYGSVKRKMSLITTELYRRYVEIFDKYKLDKWWWLATADSTPTHTNNTWVRCVSPVGNVNYHFCNYERGVRPFCILKSNIFVSK